MKSTFLIVVLSTTVALSASAQSFVDIAADSGIDFEHQLGRICEPPPIGVGSAWADYDNDGDIDLFVTNQNGPNRLYRNDGDIGSNGLPDFSEWAAAQGVDEPLEAGLGTVFVDYDNDGDQDLFISNWNGNSFYENQLTETGTVSFVDISETSGLVDAGRAITAAWGDYDRDGYLDVYLAKHAECIELSNSQDALYRNNGDGTFRDVTPILCADGDFPCEQLLGLGFSAGWVDYDNDGDSDLYLANDNIDRIYYQNVLWRNDGPNGLGGWIFTDVSESSGADFNINAMGLGIGDIDNDGDFELALSNVGANKLADNLGDGSFDDISEAAGIERAELPAGGTSITWATVFLDFDNDQLLDLFIASGYITGAPFEHPNVLFKNNGDRTFQDVSEMSGLDHPGRARAASIADVDDDGFVDLYVGNYGEAPLLYRNLAPDQGVTNHWLTVETSGTISNADAIGAIVEITTDDGVTQKRLISSGATHGGGDQRRAFFGLGEQAGAEVSIRWPSGLFKLFGSFDADQHLVLNEPPIELVLEQPTPATAGQVNRFDLAGGIEEGQEVTLHASLSEGSTTLTNCPGVVGDLENQRQVDVKLLDAAGKARFEVFVPAGVAGQTGYFQVVQSANCAISNVVEVTFQ